MDHATSATTAPTAIMRWRSRLAPFLRALQFKLRVDATPLVSRDELHQIWIAVNYFATETFHAATWASMLEALELLDLLVRVDAPVGWTLLLEIADVDRVFRINEPLLFDYAAVAPQFTLELESAEMLPFLVPAFEAVRSMVELRDERGRSPAFVEIQRELEETWRARHDGQPFHRATQERRIRIKPSLRVEGVNMMRRTMYDLDLLSTSVEQARTQWALMDHHEKQRVTNPFVVDALDVRLSDSAPPYDEIVDTLISVARRNVVIANLVVEPMLLDSDNVDVLFFKLLRPPRGHTALSRLELTAAEWTDQGVQALCTTLAHSRGLNEFVLSCANPIHWLWAPWLAFALFRADTTHDIRSVTLTMKGFADHHVQTMRHVLELSDALTVLAAGSDPNDTNSPRVEWTGTGSRITRLTLDYVDPAPRSAVLELLGLIGASLERLSLKHYGVGSFSHEFMDAVLVSCPNLQRLEIVEAGGSLEWLYTPRPDDRPRATPSSLVLEGRMESPTVIEFFKALGRSDHFLSKTLAQLHCSLWRSRTPPFDMYDAWLDMLDNNRQLERSEIVMSEKGVSAYKLAKYRERFEAHNGDRLEDPQRLAFLSAMSSRTFTLVASPLTCETMQLVMDFAWERKKRVCG